jgi:hypothetical protein
MLRIHAVTLIFSFATILTACGSSSDDSSNGGNGGAGGSGGNSKPMNDCSLTKCPVDKTAIHDVACAEMKASPTCWPLAKSWIDCHRANDECLSDGTQDVTKLGRDCINKASDVASCYADGGVN